MPDMPLTQTQADFIERFLGVTLPGAVQSTDNAEQADTGEAPGGLSIVKLGKARLEWPQVRDQAMVDLGRLKDQIREDYEDDPDAAGEVTSALGMLDKSLAAFQIKLHERLDEVLSAEGDARTAKVGEARKIINAFNKHIDSDPVLGALDSNEILPDLQITAPLRQKLSEISAALGG